MLERFYRQGRKQYGLTASEAFAYAQDRVLVWTSDLDVWVDVDYEGDVVDGRYTDLSVAIHDDEIGEVVDALGGVTIDFEVSDHGNINFDEQDPWYIGLVASMIRGYEAQREAA